MPKESQFIKGFDALHATKVCFFYWNQQKTKLNNRKGANQSGKTSQLFMYKMEQNKTKSRKIRFKN